MSVVEDWFLETIKREFGFEGLLPVQTAVVPYITRALNSHLPMDTCISAPTGSGKTLCYLAPLLQYVAAAHARGEGTQLRAVILAPSKQLVEQVTDVASKLCKGQPFQVVALGSSANTGRGGGIQKVVRTVDLADGSVASIPTADVAVTTPQHLLKLISSTDARLSIAALRLLVIDEADEVLGGSFTNFAGRVIALHEETAHPGAVLTKVLCSATLTTHIAKVSEVNLKNPKFFNLNNQGSTVTVDETELHKFTMPSRLHEHWLTVGDHTQRHAIFLKVMKDVYERLGKQEEAGKCILVFCSTNETVRVMCQFLSAAGLPALEFANASSVVERRKAVLDAFRGHSTIVVATDALMRGIDLPGVGAVVMYDAPRTLQQYIHRTGRTARASCVGHSYALLGKFGEEGDTAGGEITIFKSFKKHLQRSNNVTHERKLQALSDVDLDEANGLLTFVKTGIPPNKQKKAIKSDSESTEVDEVTSEAAGVEDTNLSESEGSDVPPISISSKRAREKESDDEGL